MTCISAFSEVQYPKPEHEKEPFWTGGGNGCRAWSGSVFDPIFDHSQDRNTWKQRI